MKKLLSLAALLALSGCAQIDDYAQVVRAPAPAELVGYWQSSGPQSQLVSPEAVASLVVTAEGDTFDCRQWQRVIALPGKLTLRSGELYNVTVKRELYDIERQGEALEYAGMSMKRVGQLTPECTAALAEVSLASTRS